MVNVVDNWPYTNLHNINLDWVLQQIKTLGYKLDNLEGFFPKISEWNNGEWDIDHAYNPNEIVTNGNDIYMAKTNVPTGVNINNTDYWLLVGTDSYITDKVSKSGDTMSGDLVFLNCCPKTRNTDIDINIIPNQLINHDVIATYDANNSEISMMRIKQTAAGDIGVEFDARRTVNNNTIFNGITFAIQADGTRYINVSDTAIWKAGLGLTWSTANSWVDAVNAAKMDILVCFSFAVGNTQIRLDVYMPVVELDETYRFHFSPTAYVSGSAYHAQVRARLSGLDYTGVYDSNGTQISEGVTTTIYYR